MNGKISTKHNFLSAAERLVAPATKTRVAFRMTHLVIFVQIELFDGACQFTVGTMLWLVERSLLPATISRRVVILKFALMMHGHNLATMVIVNRVKERFVP